MENSVQICECLLTTFYSKWLFLKESYFNFYAVAFQKLPLQVDESEQLANKIEVGRNERIVKTYALKENISDCQNS